MRYLKMLSLAAITAASLMAFTASSSASPLTSPEGTVYTSTLKAESEGALKLDGSFTTVECQKSTVQGSVESHAGTTASGNVSSLTFSECNYSVTVKTGGSLTVEKTAEGIGTLRSTGAEISIATSVGTCVFTTNGTHIGTVTDSNFTGGGATLDIDSSKIPRTGGTAGCGLSGTWTGGYEVTTPSQLYLGHPLGTDSPLTSPASTLYTGMVKAESSNSELDGSFVTVKCSESTAEGKIAYHSSTNVTGGVAGLAFGGCNYAVTVLKRGLLNLNTGSGVVVSSGAEVSISTSVGLCVFTTNNTDIGTITDSSETKGAAVLDINSAKIPRTGGNFLCGSSGEWTGSYKVTTPIVLFVGHPPDPPPLTSPVGTLYTGAIKAEAESTELDGAFVGVKCSESSVEGAIATHTSSTVSGPLGSLAFGKCNYAVTVLKTGSLSLSTSSGAVTSTGAEVSIATSVGTCVFTTNATSIGALTDTNATGGAATLHINSAKIPRTGGNFLCGSSGTWTGSYKVTTPNELYLSHGPLTSPEGTPYASTIKAASEGSISLDGQFGTVSCQGSALEGKIESHGPSSASGKLSSWTFDECTDPVTVETPGSFKIHDVGGGEGTVTSTGAKISISTSVGTCVFTASATDLGALAGSDLTEGNATLDSDFAAIPRTGGSSECGPSAVLTGSYDVTTPSTLYID